MNVLLTKLVDVEVKFNQSEDLEVVKLYFQTVKKFNLIQIIYWILNWMTAITFFVQYFRNYFIYLENEQASGNSTQSIVVKPPTPLWLPFHKKGDYVTGPVFQTFHSSLATGNYTCIQILLLLLSLNITLRLKVLRITLKSINGRKGIKTEAVKQIISNCVEEHVDIISNCTLLNNTVNYVFLLDFIVMSVQLSMGLFQVTSSDEFDGKVFGATYSIQLIGQLLILYWHANEIGIESVALADTVYELRWYNYEKSVRKNLQIMLMRAQHPLTLTVGPFGPATLETGIKVIKAAYTYVTLMQQTSENLANN